MTISALQCSVYYIEMTLRQRIIMLWWELTDLCYASTPYNMFTMNVPGPCLVSWSGSQLRSFVKGCCRGRQVFTEPFTHVSKMRTRGDMGFKAIKLQSKII